MKDEQEKFVVAINQHRLLGNILTPYVVAKDQNANFFSIKFALNEANIDGFEHLLKDYEIAIVKKLDEFSDKNLFKIYSREKDVKTFLQKVKSEKVNNFIRPYAEKRMHEVLQIISKNSVPFYYKDKKFTNIYEDDRIYATDETVLPIFNFIRTPQNLTYFLSLEKGEEKINLTHKKADIIVNDPCWLVLDHKLLFIHDIDGKKLTPFFTKKAVSIPKSAEKKYFETFILNSLKRYKVNAQGFRIDTISLQPEAILSLEEDLNAQAVLLLKFKYDQRIFLANNKTNVFISLHQENDTYSYKRFIRDANTEKHTYNLLKKLGLTSTDYAMYYPEKKQESISDKGVYDLIKWLNINSELLKQEGIQVQQHFFKKKYFTKKIQFDFSIEHKTDWFDVKAKVKAGEFEIPFKKFRKHILNYNREFELPDGSIFVIPLEWFSRYRDLFQFANKKGDELQIDNHHFQLINDQLEGINEHYFKDFEHLAKPDEARNLPDGLQATLREYQYEGFKWMKYLKQNHFGGCLADDMGLGKTLQTLTLLLHNKQNFVPNETVQASPKPKVVELSLFDTAPAENKFAQTPTNLIIAPLSLIHNWDNEIRKFTPGLSTHTFAGVGREKETTVFENYDVILTTYGVVRNDIELLSQFNFNYVILDESQVIKNPSSKIYKAVCELQSDHKLVLTGTPIENSLTDLWSQLNFLNDGILGNLSFFKEEFVHPIEKAKNEEQQEKLQKLIQPFILRRTKQQVAKELPPKSEQVVYCEMSEAQKKLYDSEKSSIRNAIFEKIEEGGMETAAFQVLQALTKLRQIANHPVLADEAYNLDSGKFDAIVSHIESLVAEKHKVLIFSSFVKHLELFEDYFKAQEWKYSKLTGQSKKRENIVKQFQDDPENRLFLISLKAGGVGLNLTEADYVFILDPWWNPASEDQAINRAHRIGQNKNVFVYRFISSGTIEQKIRLLQERKAELADTFINTNNPFKDMDMESIKDLFS